MIAKLRWLGITLVLIGIVGFLTVADDLRHKGELIGVGTILVIGLLMLSASFLRRRKE